MWCLRTNTPNPPQRIEGIIRLKANNNLYREIEHLMTRPVGRPSIKPKVFFHAFSYQAVSWRSSRRVIARVEWHAGKLFPRIGFIVTNMSSSQKAVNRRARDMIQSTVPERPKS